METRGDHRVRFIPIKAMSRLFELRQKPSPISGTAFVVGAAVASFMDAKSFSCHPSRSAISARAGIHPRNVSRYLKELEGRFLQIEYSSGQTSTYKLVLDYSDPPHKSDVTSEACRERHQTYQGTLGDLDARKEEKKKNLEKKPSASPKGQPDHRVKALVDYFCEKHKEVFGQTYVVSGGRDGAIFKNLLSADHDLETIQKGIDFFLTTPDEWLDKVGRTVPKFPDRFVAFLQSQKKPRKRDRRGGGDYETYNF